MMSSSIPERKLVKSRWWHGRWLCAWRWTAWLSFFPEHFQTVSAARRTVALAASTASHFARRPHAGAAPPIHEGLSVWSQLLYLCQSFDLPTTILALWSILPATAITMARPGSVWFWYDLIFGSLPSINNSSVHNLVHPHHRWLFSSESRQIQHDRVFCQQ